MSVVSVRAGRGVGDDFTRHSVCLGHAVPMARAVRSFLATVLLVTACAACDRQDCDAALEVVCACPTASCGALGSSPPAVDMLRSCDDPRSGGYDLPGCIQQSKRYCGIVAALHSGDLALCSEPCTREDPCDLQQACHEFQYAHCDLPVRDSGASDADKGDS